MDITFTKDGNISGIVVAMYYLSKEAERMDLQIVSGRIRSAINEIEVWIRTGEDPQAGDRAVMSYDAFSVLEFFDNYLRASPAARASFLATLKSDQATA